jgi:hypothetical protein
VRPVSTGAHDDCRTRWTGRVASRPEEDCLNEEALEQIQDIGRRGRQMLLPAKMSGDDFTGEVRSLQARHERQPGLG